MSPWVTTVVAPLVLALLVAFGIGYAVVTNEKFYNAEQQGLVDTGSLSDDLSLDEERRTLRRAISSIELSTYEELNAFVVKVRASTRTDIPRARTFVELRGNTVTQSLVDAKRLHALSVESLTREELERYIVLAQKIMNDRNAILSAYNAIPASEINVLTLGTVQPKAPSVPAFTAPAPTAPSITITEVSYPYVTVTYSNLPTNAFLVILHGPTGQQREQSPPPQVPNGGSGTVSILMNESVESGVYYVRAVRMHDGAWHVDSLPFTIKR